MLQEGASVPEAGREDDARRREYCVMPGAERHTERRQEGGRECHQRIDVR